MEWLILGVVLGFIWHWLIAWSRARRLRISWWVWFLLIFAVVAGLSGVQNYIALNADYEERAAAMVLPVYAVQTVIPLLLALVLLWRQARRARA